MRNANEKAAFLNHVREYFGQYGVDAFEMQDGKLTDEGTIALQELSEKYREVGDTSLDQDDAFAVVVKAWQEAAGIE